MTWYAGLATILEMVNGKISSPYHHADSDLFSTRLLFKGVVQHEVHEDL